MTTAILLIFAALAPVAYAVFQGGGVRDGATSASQEGEGADGAVGKPSPSWEEVHGTWLGWCAAATITLFAVEGSLAAAFIVVRDDLLGVTSWARGLCLVVIALVALLVLAYALRTYHVMRKVEESGGSARSLTGIVAVSCCDGDEGRIQLRMTLL